METIQEDLQRMLADILGSYQANNTESVYAIGILAQVDGYTPDQKNKIERIWQRVCGDTGDG